MSVSLQSQPVPGTTHPGDLYVDLQSRQLWLGVDPAVDANESVLVSDMLALQAADTTTLNNAKAYTDSQITTRAPVSHTHTSSQITDFTAAVTAVATAIPSISYTRGMIMMWSGSLAEIGVGSLAGWSLCDGSNGTPDLRDRFILGAGNLAVGARNPITSVNTSLAGAHTPVIQGHVLSWGEVGAHYHNVSVSGSGNFLSGGRTAGHTHQPSDGSYNFVVYKSGGGAPLGTTYVSGGQPLNYVNNTASESADHQHYTNVNLSSSGTTDYQPANGSTAAHSHGANAVPDHQHTLTSNQVRDVSPYYALAYIMKL
jgi:hypothetical protein